MASKIQSVADALVSQIETGEAAGTFSKSIVTERAYDTTKELEDTSTISVLVVPVEADRTRKSEGTYYYDVVLDVLVRKRFASDEFTDGKIEREAVDEYVELLEQIDDYLSLPVNHSLTTYADAVYVEDDTAESDRNITRGLGIRFPWVPEDLIIKQQYTGVLRVAYHVEVAYP